MTLRLSILVVAVSLIPTSVLADDLGFFAGVDLTGGAAFGSSSTTDGGAPWAGGGVVGNVDFGRTVGLGGHIGYRFDPALSGYLSYRHVRGDVSWDATFPLLGEASDFAGTAISNVLMGNLAYEFVLSDKTSVRASAGAGLSFNSLSGVVETDAGTGVFLSDVMDHTRISPAAQVGAGLEQKIAPDAALDLDASVNYAGGFETGNARSGNLGVTPITPYKIDNVWRADLSAAVRFAF